MTKKINNGIQKHSFLKKGGEVLNNEVVECKWTKEGEEFFCTCFCGKKVKGEEISSPRFGGRPNTPYIFFYCSCIRKWEKAKEEIIWAINGGYRNGFGVWIPCSKTDGNPTKEGYRILFQEPLPAKA